MENYINNMENNMVNLFLDGKHLPIVMECNIITASEDFFHRNRIADFNVLIYVTDGIMYVTEDGQDYEIHAGEMLFLKNGIQHFGKQKTLRGTRWFYAHFLLDEGRHSTITDDSLIIPKKVSGLFSSKSEDFIFELCKIFNSNEPMKTMYSNGLLYQLLLEISSETMDDCKTLSDQICDYLETQMCMNFSKRKLEEQFCLSYSHLAATFKNEKGQSMGQFHNELRMKKACQLLRSTLLSVSEIAEQLGFSDVLYFSKKFHSYSGMSPSNYRKQIQRLY